MQIVDYIAIQVLEPSDNVGLEEKCDLISETIKESTTIADTY